MFCGCINVRKFNINFCSSTCAMLNSFLATSPQFSNIADDINQPTIPTKHSFCNILVCSVINDGHMSTKNNGQTSTRNNGQMSIKNNGHMSTKNNGHMSTKNSGPTSTKNNSQMLTKKEVVTTTDAVHTKIFSQSFCEIKLINNKLLHQKFISEN